MVWKIIAVFVAVLLGVFLVAGPTIAESTATEFCGLLESVSC